MPDQHLTQKQGEFVEHFLGDAHGNATQAARLAGYQGDDRTLQVVGSRNVSHPAIAARLRARVAAVALTADEVLAELATIARADWRDFVDVQIGRDSKPVGARIMLGDKVRALELLGKYHGMWRERIDATISVKTITGVNLDDV